MSHSETNHSETNRSIRRGAFLAAAVLLTAGLVACTPGGATNTPTEPVATGSNGAPAPVTLTWWDYYQEGSSASEALQGLLDKYQEENSTVTINREFIAYADLKQSILQSAGAGSLPDVVIINGPDHQQFAELGVAVNLDEQLAEWGELDQYAPGVIASASYNGSVYGLPASANTLALFYNKELLDAAGLTPPTTWEEMEATAAALTTSDTYGFAYSAINNQQAVFQFLPALWQSGADLYDLTSDDAAASLDYWAGLVDAGSVSKEALNWDQKMVAIEFAEGRAAMMINGPWQLPFLASDAPNIDYGVALLPAGKVDASVTGGENYMIMTGPNEVAAWDLLKWLQKPENVSEMVIAGGSLSTRNDIDPYPGNDIMNLFAEQLQVAKPRAYGPAYAEIADQVVVAIQARLTGAASSSDALKTAASAIKPLLP